MVRIRIHNLVKSFGRVAAVDGVTLEASPQQITVLLGPSGCGKTTILRCVAGLDRPQDGEIYIGDLLATHSRKGVFVPPEQRNVGMVFQSYAIWPHLTVFENVAYGLRARRLRGEEIGRRVGEAVRLVKLEGLESRYPTQLSGGQQQRVALARALAIDPGVLLLDEPLSNLDAKLRESTRFELLELQRRSGITFLYVTHDQAEAMVIADRICVLQQGKVRQIGTSKEIYERPADEFVADFVGLANFLSGTVVGREGRDYIMRTSLGEVRCRLSHSLSADAVVAIALRPERLILLPTSAAVTYNVWRGTIHACLFAGDHLDCQVAVAEHRLRVKAPVSEGLAQGQEIYVHIPADKVISVPSRPEPLVTAGPSAEIHIPA